ncbi:hypothetical protein RGR602_CH00420 [Rhizobium gallicum bv. gallicum R602sp]|uniref:Uncharacterized protein n=1 Tax=Rhizobium gallicum bv. gallicum R602sp TaxID=1041138 RepID=A0A0B4WXU7_9HYPH|nr:hypothetical protein RGR602_CH00420 [Rhizobium gallicum bv. gallicum R602sp]
MQRKQVIRPAEADGSEPRAISDVLPCRRLIRPLRPSFPLGGEGEIRRIPSAKFKRRTSSAASPFFPAGKRDWQADEALAPDC